jgi:hypothetical protein
MKVLCPRCNEPIDLGYLEKNGSQMAPCPGCGTVVAATYKKDDKRIHWKFEVESPLSENSAEEPGCGCGAATLILIGLLIVIAMARCDSQDPDRPPDDAPAEEVRNRLWKQSR